MHRDAMRKAIRNIMVIFDENDKGLLSSSGATNLYAFSGGGVSIIRWYIPNGHVMKPPRLLFFMVLNKNRISKVCFQSNQP